MTLSASSFLHYWSSRYGSVPLIGGKPNHSRPSAGAWTDQKGTVQSAIVHTPRFPWAIIAGEKRPVMRLEQSATNEWTRSDDFSAGAGWGLSNVTSTPNAAIAPDGNLTATLLQASSTSTTNNNCNIGAIGSSFLTYSIFVKPIPGITALVHFDLYDITAAADLSIGTFDPVAGTFVDSGGVVGRSRFIEQLLPSGPTDGWYRLYLSAPCTSGHTFQIYAGYTGGPSTAGDGCYVWRADVEPSPRGTSAILTPGSIASRSADSFYWDFASGTQAAAYYVRFVERGTIFTSASQVLGIGDASANIPFLGMDASGGFYRVAYFSSFGTRSALMNVAPAYGDTVELMGIFRSDGSLEMAQSINGGAYTNGGGRSIAGSFNSQFSAPRLYLNSAGTLQTGTNDFAEVKIVKAADLASLAGTVGDMLAELRAAEITSNGELIGV